MQGRYFSVARKYILKPLLTPYYNPNMFDEKYREQVRDLALKAIGNLNALVASYKAGNKNLMGSFVSEAFKLATFEVEPSLLTTILQEELDKAEISMATQDNPHGGLYLQSATIVKDIIPFTEGESFSFKKGINLLVGDQGCGKSTLLNFLMNSHTHQVDMEALKRSASHLKYEGQAQDDAFVNDMGQGGATMKMGGAGKDLYADHAKIEGDFSAQKVFIDTEQHNPRTMEGDITSRGALGAVFRFCQELAQENPAMEETLKSKFAAMANSGANAYASTDAIIQSRMKSHGQVIFPMLKQINETKKGIIFLDEPETSLSIRSQYKLAEVIKEAAKNDGCQLFIATHSEILMGAVETVLSLEHRKWMTTEEFIATQKDLTINHNQEQTN